MGYDLDPMSERESTLVEIFLWWQGEGPKPDSAILVGEWSIQTVRAVNLAPSFDWSVDMAPTTLPMGFASGYVTGGPRQLTVIQHEGRSTLRFPYQGISSIRTYPIALDSMALYLTHARVESLSGEGGIGRKCFYATYPEHFRNNLWGAPVEPKKSVLEWQVGTLQTVDERADLSYPLEERTTFCQLTIEVHDGEALISDLLFTLLLKP